MDKRKTKAVFTIWKDQIKQNKSILTSQSPKVQKKNGFSDQEKVIDEVITWNLPAYGLICEASDTKAATRSIKSIDETYAVQLSIKRINGIAEATHLKEVHFADVVRGTFDSALDDLADSAPEGNQNPDRALHTGYSYKRDGEVRSRVLKRAKGRCEYCGEEGFLMNNGVRYLEAHHIISLADQGPDTMENVIALCPKHHREAHYGAQAEALEEEFLKIVESRTS
jgi:5-methylcytosine-specific restriction protein A